MLRLFGTGRFGTGALGLALAGLAAVPAGCAGVPQQSAAALGSPFGASFDAAPGGSLGGAAGSASGAWLGGGFSGDDPELRRAAATVFAGAIDRVDLAALESLAMQSESTSGRSGGHIALWYIPNRISDVLDIVRARLRVGPGLAFGARATELLDVFVGGYGALFIGIPGPRGEPGFNWPFGVESNGGAEVSFIDFAAEGDLDYGVAEIGFGAQILIFGFDLGLDVFEAADFVTGLFTVDLIGDDT